MKVLSVVGGSTGGIPLFGLYGDVPLDRVWFPRPVASVLDKVRTCTKQGVV